VNEDVFTSVTNEVAKRSAIDASFSTTAIVISQCYHAVTPTTRLSVISAAAWQRLSWHWVAGDRADHTVRLRWTSWQIDSTTSPKLLLQLQRSSLYSPPAGNNVRYTKDSCSSHLSLVFVRCMEH